MNRTDVVQSALRALYLTVLPALAAACIVRFGLPSPLSEGFTESERNIARAAVASPIVTGVGIFLLLATLLRYWRARLPFGRYLTSLPAARAKKVSVAYLEDYSTAFELERRLSRAVTRGHLADLDGAELDRERGALRRALKKTDPAALLAARDALLLRTQTFWSAERTRQLASTVALFGVAALLALALRGRMFQSYRVEGASMLPTLQPGEIVVANRLQYQPLFSASVKAPRRGEVIVLRRAGESRADDLVKRVIGLAGDRISVRSGMPRINGWDVPHCDAGRYAEMGPSGVTDGRVLVEFLGSASYLTVFTAIGRVADEYVVPKGEVFVLGDNRNESLDSRFWNEGKPGGLRLADIDGQVTRVLSQARRDQTPSFAGFLRPLGLDIHLPNVDIRNLESGIARCLATRPANTEPPTADTRP